MPNAVLEYHNGSGTLAPLFFPFDDMILIGVGSNQGDSIQRVADACAGLQVFAGGGLRVSQLWRTAPVDCPPDSPDFINAAVAFRGVRGLTPERLLEGLKAQELRAGRLPRPRRNAPRPLDLDLLVYGQQRRSSARLKLPHPRAVLRRFVLGPAAEVAPNLRWPGTGRTVLELLAELPAGERALPLPLPPGLL